MALSEQLLAVEASHSTYVQRIAAKFGNDAQSYLDKIDREVNKLLAAMPQKKVMTQRQIDRLASTVRAITDSELRAYTSAYKANNIEFGVYEGAYQAKALDATITGYVAKEPAKNVMKQYAIRTPIKLGEDRYTTYNRFIASYHKKYTEEITATVEAGFQFGLTNREIAARISEQIGGDLKRAANSAKTLARTGTNHYASSAMQAFVDRNDKVLIGYRYLAVMDSRTSARCRSLDQRVFKFDDDNIPYPPQHPNCRSSIVPEVDGRYKYNDDSADRPAPFDVNGKKTANFVSSKDSYYQGMSELSARDQDAILGPTWGRAFRKMDDPNLFAKQTLDSTYDPLSIKDATKKDNELGRILRDITKK